MHRSGHTPDLNINAHTPNFQKVSQIPKLRKKFAIKLQIDMII